MIWLVGQKEMIDWECALNSSLSIIKTKTLDRNTNSKKAVFLLQQEKTSCTRLAGAGSIHGVHLRVQTPQDRIILSLQRERFLQLLLSKRFGEQESLFCSQTRQDISYRLQRANFCFLHSIKL